MRCRTRGVATRLVIGVLTTLLAPMASQPTTLHAQQPAATTASVRGTVLDAVTGRPVAGAVVQAMTRDSMIARTLSDERGRFVFLAAPVSAVRVRRIGYRPADAPVTAAIGEITVRLTPLVTLLQPVAVRANARCATGPNVAVAHAIYEQVREALLAEIVTRETRSARSRLVRYRRPIDDPARPMVTQEVVVESLEDAAGTFTAARSPALFVQRGFATERTGDGDGERAFLGPDTELLSHDLFRETWCLTLADRDKDAPTLVGIRFTPVARRPSIVDIDGRLWIDTATRTLQRVEYAYLNLSDAEKSVAPGGRIEFRTMPNGAVFVERWSLRVAQPVGLRAALSVFRGSAVSRARPLDTGGEVAAVQWSDGSSWRGSLPSLRVVARTESGAPQAGVTLGLAGTGYAARTDSAGVAVLEDVLPGRYRVVVLDSVLQRVDITLPTPLRVDVARGPEATHTVVAPTRASFVKSVCGVDTAVQRLRRYDAQADSLTEVTVEPGTTAVVLMRVVDRTGKPLSGVQVFDAVTIPRAPPLTTPRAPRSRSDADGRLVSCFGYAPGETIQVLAQPQGGEVQGLVHTLTAMLEAVVLVVRR